MTVRSTYALDPETIRRLEEVARRWGVSKSEALRRAIRSAATSGTPERQKMESLKKLQASLGLTRQSADAWIEDVRRERKAFGRRLR
jgi:hypothetical protein